MKRWDKVSSKQNGKIELENVCLQRTVKPTRTTSSEIGGNEKCNVLKLTSEVQRNSQVTFCRHSYLS